VRTGFSALGVPIDSVGRAGGTEHAPAALRELGLIDVLGGYDVGDLDVRIRGEERDPDTGVVGSDDVLATTATVRRAVMDLVSVGERPFLIGGCCTELPGAMAGARDAIGRVGLAYVDGHLDLYDGVTSPTGEAADMPVSVIVGRGPVAWLEACDGPGASPADVAVLGHRDLPEALDVGMVDPAVLGPGFTHVDADAVRAQGPGAVGVRTAARLEDELVGFWLHLDVDVLDETVFPATDYLMPGGLDADQLVELLRPLATSSALIGTSLGCYNPEKDPDRSSGRLLVDVWHRALAP
jgi:arginase